MTDHIGEATKKVIDLDALEKLANGVIGGWSKSRVLYEPEAATIKALIAELKEARSTVEELLYAHTDKSIAMGRAFLARNGKGEG